MQLFINPIVEISISLIFVYALLSILSSILVEWWNHYRKSRGKLLQDAIIQLLHDPYNLSYGELLMNHFLIQNLRNPHNRRPAQYISSNLFAEALIDIIAQQARHNLKISLPKADDAKGKIEVVEGQKKSKKSKQVFVRFKAGLEMMNPSPLRDTFFSFFDKAEEGDYTKLKAAFEQWYNDYMDRVTGWYKTKMMRTNIIFGFIIAISLNVDSIHLFRVLSMDSALRQEMLEVAETAALNYQTLADSSKQNSAALTRIVQHSLGDTSTTSVDSTHAKELIRRADTLTQLYVSRADSILGVASALNVPIGWNKRIAPLSWFWKKESDKKAEEAEQKKRTTEDESESNLHQHPNRPGLLAYNERRNHCPDPFYFLGILISGFALSFGSPFWFELLVRLVNIRKSGGKPKLEA